jgi:hypothetical protein
MGRDVALVKTELSCVFVTRQLKRHVPQGVDHQGNRMDAGKETVMKRLSIMLGTVALATMAILGAAVPASAHGWWGGRGGWGRPYARSYGYRSGYGAYAYVPRRGYRSYRRGYGRPYGYRSW